MRRASRKDLNQTPIAEALYDAGLSVQFLHTVGAGCPDLLVGRAGVNYLLELKSARGKLTPAELAWHLTWRGQVAVVRTIEEALRVLGL